MDSIIEKVSVRRASAYRCDPIFSVEDSCLAPFKWRLDRRGYPIPYIGSAEANVEFIVTACNSHDALLKAAKRALAVLRAVDGQSATPTNVIGALEAAIALAESSDTEGGKR